MNKNKIDPMQEKIDVFEKTIKNADAGMQKRIKELFQTDAVLIQLSTAKAQAEHTVSILKGESDIPFVK